MSLDLDDHELILLKSALLAYKSCPNCSHEYPRTHSIVTIQVLPKIKKLTDRRLEGLVDLDQQLKFVSSEEVI
jgi:hypothetical protein